MQADPDVAGSSRSRRSRRGTSTTTHVSAVQIRLRQFTKHETRQRGRQAERERERREERQTGRWGRQTNISVNYTHLSKRNNAQSVYLF